MLDVGAAGTGPLELWRSLPLPEMPIQVVATDVDQHGIDRARQLHLNLELRCASAYDLVDNFGAESFDLVISTQVLEHIARPEEFMAPAAAVLRPGGRLWATLDSGHFSRSHAGDPAWKRIARPLVSRLVERHYDFGLTESQVAALVKNSGLRLLELCHCNLGPIKLMVSAMSAQQTKEFMPLWLRLEQALAPVPAPASFRGIYFAARRG